MSLAGVPPVMLDRHLAVAVDPLCPAALMDARALAIVHRIAARLPAELTDFFGFECRLSDPQASADFLVCIKPPGRGVLAGEKPGGLPDAWQAQPAWSRIAGFARRWQDPATGWHDQVQNLWAEFDLAGIAQTGGDQPPVPSVFLGSDALPGGAASPAWLADDALPLLRGEPLSPALRTRLDATLAHLPSSAQVFQVGMMLSRPEGRDALRLCMRRLELSQAQDLVQFLDWPGPAGELARAWQFAQESATDIALDLDLLPACGPKIGLECSFGFGADAQHRLQRFIDALAERGLCLPAKRDGLLGWTRAFHARRDPQAWPADLRARAAAAAEPTVSMLMRWVYHVKLVLRPHGPWEAKAYLAVAQSWMTPQRMQHVKHASATCA